MTNSKPALRAGLVMLALSILMALTGRQLAEGIRFGLEFRGGYEIYYVAAPLAGKVDVTPEDMRQTAAILMKRADSIGMAEPEIHIEGDRHIRVKLAGLTSAEESRSLLGSSAGLPTVLTEKYTQTVGSVLGKTALKETMTAGLIGVVAIFALLLVLYRASGLVAAFSTVVYLWILLVAFNAAHATLSLSAVVAFVLGLGMAADASIICFERVREDLERGHEPVDAVILGFKESFGTIRDANLVTALAMLALFVAGIGPIQGFSLTMIASIVISIGTNFFLTRQLLKWLAQAGLSPSVLVGGAKAKPRAFFARFDFTRFGKAAIFVSAATIAAGTVYYRAHGLNLDIDFTAGTALDIDLDRAIDQDTATRIMSEAGIVPATVAIGGARNEHIAARFDEVLKPADLKKVIGAFQAKYGEKVVYEENTADPGVAHEFAMRAVYAVLAAFASIGLYIGLRFSWAIAAATLLPILHDILLVSAIFALFKFEIDVTYVAALLTIIGYSLNDKIVIFGRVRENLRLGNVQSLPDLVNMSVRQTLGRSIYTVLTVVMASMALYLFACEPLEMFALALVLGLISGAYSSIFMSTVLWLSFAKTRSTPLMTGRFAGALGAVAVAGILGWQMVTPHFSGSSAAANLGAHDASGATGPLGDLSTYAKIVEDSLTSVRSGDLVKAKARIKDLETAWDGAEESMQPKSPEDWKAVDKAIDRALSDLRSSSPEAAACETSLKTLFAKMASLQTLGGGEPAGASTSPLGDLTQYELIGADTLRIVEGGDLAAAKARIKDLETAWDEAEETMQPRSPNDWTAVDKAIDRALSQLRSGTPEKAACEAALNAMIAKMKSVDGPH